jgi:hypothetical protein
VCKVAFFGNPFLEYRCNEYFFRVLLGRNIRCICTREDAMTSSKQHSVTCVWLYWMLSMCWSVTRNYIQPSKIHKNTSCSRWENSSTVFWSAHNWNSNVFVLNLFQVLIVHVEDQNVGGLHWSSEAIHILGLHVGDFTEAVEDYGSILRLDQWYKTILLRINNQINDVPCASAS